MRLRLIHSELSEQRVRRSVFRILRENVLCAIATVTPRKAAQIATVYFSYSDDLELFFLSDPGSHHCENVSRNPSMAAAVFSSRQEWGGPDRGVQLFGTCRQARGLQVKMAERIYAKRFPAYARWKASFARGDARRAYRFYRFRPERLTVLDESEFGDAVFIAAAVRPEAGTVSSGHLRRPRFQEPET